MDVDAVLQPPSAAEIAAATDVLRRISATALREDPAVAPLRDVGIELFSQEVLRVKFNAPDAIEYLKQLNGHKELLKKLQKLKLQIDKEHELRKAEAASCGINRIREERLAAIEAACAREDGGVKSFDKQGKRLLKHTGGTQDPTTSTEAEAAPAAAKAEAEAAPAAATDEFTASLEQTARIPAGSFRKHCNTCKTAFSAVHHFYHQLCPPCAELNYAKRLQSADLSGCVCVVTGGRVRIGYQIVLKLLRAGAYVLTTSRFPADAALRYEAEADFEQWRSRLEVCGPLELSNVKLVEEFCRVLLRRFRRIHVLVNNAAQTLTRGAGWEARMLAMEEGARDALRPEAAALLSAPAAAGSALLLSAPCTAAGEELGSAGEEKLEQEEEQQEVGGKGEAEAAAPSSSSSQPVTAQQPVVEEAPPQAAVVGPPRATVVAPKAATPAGAAAAAAAAARVPRAEAAVAAAVAAGVGAAVHEGESSAADAVRAIVGAAPPLQQQQIQQQSSAVAAAALSAAELAAYPAGRLDESAQPLDLSETSSWSRRLGDVSTPELLHTLAANAVAPFILVGWLRCALAPTEDDKRFGHVINVSALEGKFSVGKKSGGHPHTNMAKAALNMMTLSSAGGYRQQGILVNAVDTGWVTDMAPGGVGARAATHETHVGPPLDEEDGAARVLDPVFMHVADNSWTIHGKLWKDYHVTPW